MLNTSKFIAGLMKKQPLYLLGFMLVLLIGIPISANSGARQVIDDDVTWSFSIIQDVHAAQESDGDKTVSQGAGNGAEQQSGSGLSMLITVLVLVIIVAAFFWLKVDKMRFVTKISGMGLTLLVLLALLAFISNVNMSFIGDALRVIAKDDIPLTNSVAKIATLQLQQSIWLERGVHAQAKNDMQRLEESIEEFGDYAAQVDRELGYAKDLAQNGINNSVDSDADGNFKGVLARLMDIETRHQDFNKQGNDLLSLAKQNIKSDESQVSENTGGEGKQASTGTESAAPVKLRSLNLTSFLVGVELVQDQLNRELQALEGNIGRSTANSALKAEQLEESAALNLTLISIVAAVMGIFMVMLILRSVMRQLGGDPSELLTITDQLAHGQLNIRVKNNTTGAYAAITNTVVKLKEIIGGIKAAADEVTVAAEQVSEGNTSLSQRTQEQASNLEEVASSMEEMTGTVSQNADNAQQANQLATAARQQADKGGDVVNRAVSSMHEINESSKKIADIIGVIDEIAFQTNLLALNAAVEAARAGDQGRGFAVVAGEVRNLAGRSATAAKEIKELIHDSVTKVEEGTHLVTESGEALQEIVNSVKKVSDIVAEIAAASHEQSSGIGQVNRAVMQMDDMTQQNASLVEEAAAASESMGAQAEELQSLVNFFKLGESEEALLQNKAKRRRNEKIGVYELKQKKLGGKTVTQNPAGLPKLSEKGKANDSDWEEF